MRVCRRSDQKAAVDRDARAGHVRSCIAQQEADGLRHLSWAAQTPLRNERGHLFNHAVIRILHGGIDDTRQQFVDANVVPRVVVRRRSREPVNAVLARGVGGMLG